MLTRRRTPRLLLLAAAAAAALTIPAVALAASLTGTAAPITWSGRRTRT